MEEIIMDEYFNLKSPLNSEGVFGGDEYESNSFIDKLPEPGDWINILRSQITSGISNQFDPSNYQQDMYLSFPQLLKEEGIKVRVTSEFRKNSITKSGHKSNHSIMTKWGFSGACDIVPVDGNFNKLRQQIYSNPRIKAWLVNHKMGILEEITSDVKKRTGATGDHFHVGFDKWGIQMSSKYIDYNKNYNISPSKKNVSGDGKSRMSYVKNYLMSNHGLDAIHASALTGVWYAESGLNPSIKSKRDTGQGIAQWTGSRHQSFNRFYKQLFGRQSPGITNVGLDQQIDVAIAEYKSRSSNWRDFLNRNNLQDAVDSVLRGYENGGNGLASITDIDKNYKGNGYNRQMSVRLGYAQQALK